MTTGQKIETQLDELDNVKSDFIDALEAKGVTGISPDDKYEKLVNDISKIRTPIKEKDVNFYNYDGELLYAYTKEEALALTALPEGVSDSLVNFNRWTYTLAELKRDLAYLSKMYIGALSYSKDGAMHIFVTLTQYTLSPSIRVSGSSQFSYRIDWGDGTVVTTSKTYYSQNTYSHTYSEPGDYEISMKVVSSGSGIGSPINAIEGTSSYSYLFFKDGGTTGECRLYNSCVNKIITSFYGTGLTLNNISFASYGLVGLINVKSLVLGPNNNNINNKYYRLPIEFLAVSRNDMPSSGYWFGRSNIQGLENNDSYSKLKILCLPGDITFGTSYELNSANNVKFHQPTSPGIFYTYMYYGNNAIKELALYNPTFPGYTIYNCTFLTYLKIIFPSYSSNTTLATYTISNCPNLHIIDLTGCTNLTRWTITDISKNFLSLPSDFKIVVRDSDYNNAVNLFTTVTDHIIKESAWDGKK